MRSLNSWLIVIFLIILWIFRIVVAITGQMEIDFVIKPIDVNVEIILLFVVLICIPFIINRKVIGAIVCFAAYAWYFTPSLLQNVLLVFENEIVDVYIYVEILIEAVAIILPFIAIFDILLEKSKNKNPIDKKTDWFYKNEAYDRQLDERADKNNYRSKL